MKTRLIAVLPLVFLLLSTCRHRSVEELPKEELFSLAIGKMDNQIDLFQLKGFGFEQKNRVYMRDGLFFVANGNSAKIMELSSYGDLIFLLYNPESNPPPVSFAGGTNDNLATTRIAVAYPLHQIGELAVDSGKRLYVEDTVGEERQVRDKNLGVVLSRVVLRFDRRGKLQDFIGQEGVGGTPFPYIESIFVTEQDELVVISRTPQSWQVFWYTAAGSLLYQLALDQERLPTIEGAGRSIPSLGKLVPDPNRHYLYAAIYYYQSSEGETGRQGAAGRGYSTRLFRINLSSGKYEKSFEVPEDRLRKETVAGQELEVVPPSFELLGVNTRGAFFFLRRDDNNLYQLLVLDRDGRVAARRYLVMEDSELYFKEVHLSSEGIVYAMLGEEYKARFVWWRSDRLLEELQGAGR
jgi:hypothetical protein